MPAVTDAHVRHVAIGLVGGGVDDVATGDAERDAGEKRRVASGEVGNVG